MDIRFLVARCAELIVSVISRTDFYSFCYRCCGCGCGCGGVVDVVVVVVVVAVVVAVSSFTQM